MSDEVFIASARRTPIGSFQGALAPLTSPQIGAAAIRAALDDSGLSGEQIEEAIIGCVLMAGIGQAPGRQVVLAAGLPLGVPVSSVNKMCGSGLKAVMMAADQ